MMSMTVMPFFERLVGAVFIVILGADGNECFILSVVSCDAVVLGFGINAPIDTPTG